MSMWELSVFSAQFYCKPKSALKIIHLKVPEENRLKFQMEM